jgi:hypothetical protein
MYWLFLVVGLFFAALYISFILREVPGAAKERLGELERIPRDARIWQVESEGPAAEAAAQQGQLREVRLIQDDTSGTGNGAWLRQVRYRGIESGVVERVEPDEKVKLRRIFAD